MDKRWNLQGSDVKIREGKIGKIGSGAQGCVYLAEYNNELIAAKQLSTSDKIRLRREIQHHITLSDKGKEEEDGYPMTVPEFKGFIPDDGSGQYWILMEKMPFSLSQFTVERDMRFLLRPVDKLRIMYGIAKCMMYVHLEGIIHRDLKPENVLLDAQLNVRLCDFGLARTCSDITMTRQIGTPLYQAPETYNDGHYGTKADVFSYGVLVYSTLCRDEKWVFEDDNKTQAMNWRGIQKLIKEGKRYRRGDIEDAYWELITKCWDADPEQRPSFEEIVKYFHTGFKGERKLAMLTTFKEFVAGIQKDIDVYEKIKAKRNHE